MKKIISLLILAFSLVVSQQTSLTGIITDKSSGESLIGANVIISGSSLNTGAATDFDGNYKVQNIPEGTYKINITYRSDERRVGKESSSRMSPYQ